MPIHDWLRVDAGLYHTFHQNWTIEIFRALNRGILPAGYVALTDLKVEGFEPDVAAFSGSSPPGGVAVADAPPATRMVARGESAAAAYARKATRVIVRQGLGRLAAVIEVVSPGNKDSRHAVQSFRTKAVEFLRHGTSVVVIDLFPPSPRDPEGLHQVIWDEFPGAAFDPRPADKPLTVSSFDAGADLTAYADPLAVGDPLPDTPLFLSPGRYVPLPLEPTYAAAWAETPPLIRNLVSPTPPAGTP